MSTQQLTPEFKDEAVHQVLERGYSVAEVATLVNATLIEERWRRALSNWKFA